MSKKLFFLLSILFVIISSNGFSYRYWNSSGLYLFLFYILFLFIIIVKKKKLTKIQMNLKRQAIALVLIPFLCWINMALQNNLDWLSHPNVIVSRMGSLAFLFYFVLHAYKIKEKDAVKLVLIVSFVIWFLQVYQQANPYSALFGTYTDEQMSKWQTNETTGMRNGLYRFMIPGYCFTVMAVLYSWIKFLGKRSLKNFIIFGIFISSIYLTLTRQLMAVVIIGVAITPILIGKSQPLKKIVYLLITGAILLVIYNYSDVLFGDLINLTEEQSGTDYIRFLSFDYYFDQTTKDLPSLLLGSGSFSIAEQNGINFGFYPSDIGFMGEWHYYGLFWIILYVLIVYKLLIRNFNIMPGYLKLFIIVTFMDCFMIFPYRYPYENFLWAIVLYIGDLHISKSSLVYKEQ